MARKIVITSGKGGVGKTTVCVNLAYNLAKQNKKVVCLDLDIGLNNLDVLMGMENKIIYDIVDVVERRCRVSQALIQDETCSSLYVMPASKGYAMNLVTSEKLKDIIKILNESFDYILVDCPAGIEEGFYKAVKICSEALIVTTPHISALRDANKIRNILKSLDMTETSLIINRVRGDLILSGEMLSVNAITDLMKMQVIGVLPEADDITVASNIGGPVKEGDIAQAYKMLSENVSGNSKVQIFDTTLRYKGLFGRIKRHRI